MARPLRIELEDGLYHVTTARRAYRRFVVGTIIEVTARAFGEDAGQTAQVPACTAPSSVTRAVQRVERDLPRLSSRLAKIERACINH